MHEPRLGVELFLSEHFFNYRRLLRFGSEIVKHGQQVDVRTEGFDLFVGGEPPMRLHRGLEGFAVPVETLCVVPKLAVERGGDLLPKLRVFLDAHCVPGKRRYA